MKLQKPPSGWRYPRRLRDVRQPDKADARLDGEHGGLHESLQKIECIADIERAETQRAALTEREELKREREQKEKLKGELQEEIEKASPASSIFMTIFYFFAGLLALAAEVSIVYQIVPIIALAERGVLRMATAVATSVAPSVLLKASLNDGRKVAGSTPGFFQDYRVVIFMRVLSGGFIVCLAVVRYQFVRVEADQRDPGGVLSTFLTNTPAVLVLLVIGGIVLTLVSTYCLVEVDKAIRLHRAKIRHKLLEDRCNWIERRLEHVNLWLLRDQDLDRTGEAAKLDHLRNVNHKISQQQKGGWFTRMRSLFSTGILAAVILSTVGCSTPEPTALDRRAVVVIDTSASIDGERLKEEYIEATLKVFDQLPKCASIAIVPVTELQHGEKVEVTTSCEERAFSEKKREARAQFGQTIRNHIPKWVERGRGSHYSGTLTFASNLLKPSQRRVLVVVGDMVNYTAHSRTSPNDPLRALELPQGAFQDVSVFLAFIPTSSDLRNRPDAEVEAFTTSWRKSFEKAGARDVTERLHGLAGVSDWLSSLKWEVEQK
jgi:hypothetical protein